MADSGLESRVRTVTHLATDKVHRLYQRHRQGALARTAAIIFVWLFLLLSFFLGAIDWTSFFGICITCLVVILLNIPFLWGLKRITNRIVYEYYNLSINVIEVVGDTIIIYFLGGIKGMYLIIVYAGLVAYIGVSAPKRYSYIIATICSVSFAVMVILEHFGILPHQNNFGGYHYTLVQVLMIVFTFAGTLYVLSALVSSVASILRKTRVELKRQNVELEQSREAISNSAAELEKRNTILQKSMEQLKDTQDQLFEFSKMAALGRMVAGVAHEIITPLNFGGNSASVLNNKIKRLADKISGNALTGVDLKENFKTMGQSAEFIVDNIRAASSLVKGFNQLAVDQSDDVRRKFNLKQYIEELLRLLHHKFKPGGHKVSLICPDSLNISSSPDLFVQIVINLLMNSLTHGLEDVQHGEIVVDISLENDHILLKYSDNGKGMEAATAKRIFEPFFTTRQAGGSSGLGLYIVYNIVTETMGGSIKCDTSAGKGTSFIITLPLCDNLGVI